MITNMDNTEAQVFFDFASAYHTLSYAGFRPDSEQSEVQIDVRSGSVVVRLNDGAGDFVSEYRIKVTTPRKV